MFGYARALKTSAGRRAMAMVTFMLNRRVVVFAGLERQRRDGGDEMGNLKDERVCFYRDRGAITTRGRPSGIFRYYHGRTPITRCWL